MFVIKKTRKDLNLLIARDRLLVKREAVQSYLTMKVC